MVDSEPPALALAPAPAPAPPSPECTAPATSDTTMRPANGSPVNSEKSAVAGARLRELVAQPGTHAAVFSTDGGRLPQRSIPLNAPPVIVRSAGMKDALICANYWRERHPDFHLCFFPHHGWTIADLWDEYDVHLESPEFLKEVMHVILYGNQQSAINFAYNWCLGNPDKMGKLSGDLRDFEADPLAMVNEFFSHKELGHFPRQYLLYALWVLRDSMHRYQAKCRPTSTADSDGSPVNDQPFQPVMNGHHINSDLQQPHSMPVSLRPTPPAQQVTSYGPVVPAPHMQRMRNLPFIPFHPPASNFHHGGAAISTVPTQPLKQPPNMRRPDRSGSYSFAQQAQPYTNGENVRLPPGGHTHHPVGPPHGGPHHFVPNIPIGPGMVSPGQRGLHALPNAVMTSPPIHPSQVAYPPPTGHVVLSPPGSIPPQIHNPAYQQFDHQVIPHVTPFVNLANNVPHAPVRGRDIRSISGPSGQNTKIPGLYNPYDASRPEKAGFVHTGPRKGSRGNLTNNTGRGYKYSGGAFDRSFSNMCLPEYQDYSGRFTTVDTSITNDKEFGCDFNYIGPKNTTVRQLYVRNIPDCISVPEIRTLFLNHAKATPNSIEVRSCGERKEFYNALVSFDSTNDARKALAARLPPLKGKAVQIHVAKRHFSMGPHHYAITQESNRSAGDAGQSTQSNPYSPQDARSDLHQVNGQHRQPKVQISRGSPEARKAKKPVINQEDRVDSVVKKEDASKSIAESPSAANLVAKTEAKASTTKTPSDNLTAESKSTLPKTGALPGKKETMERSNANRVSSNSNEIAPACPETITESIPLDTQTPLLVSPTKVILPPVDHNPKAVHAKSKKAVAAEDPQVSGNLVSVPLQEDAASDDDQKHDLSFHSAQESPLEIISEKDPRDQKVDSVHENEEKPGSITGKHIGLDDDQQPPVTNNGGGQKVATSHNLAYEIQEGKGAITVTSKSSAELGRKNGAKQTESLNPYSKAYKAQLKKIKDKERKQKKKDKIETTVKEEMQGVAKISITVENGEKENSGKTSSRASTQGLAQEDHGDETQAQKGTEVQDVKQDRLNHSKSPPKSAQPCDGKGLQATVATTTKDERLVMSNNQRQTSGTGQGVKSTSTVIAVPKLESLKKRSSTTTTTPPSTPQRTEKDNMDTARDAREDSPGHQGGIANHEASSLVGSTDPPARSCSPREKEFHTPVQTPTGLGRPTAEPATQKKKKKNKKKAKDAGEVSGQQSEEAFHEQLSQVKNTQAGYYALRDSDGPPQEVFVRKEDKGPKSLIRQVQAYVKEKTSSYSRAPENTWSRDNRKQVEKVTAAESQQIVNGTRLAVDPAIVHYKQDAMSAKGEAGQAGKAGKLPLFGK